MEYILVIFLIILGILLILIDIFFIPGIVIGSLCIVLIITGNILAFFLLDPNYGWISVLLSILIIGILLYLTNKLKLWDRLVLKDYHVKKGEESSIISIDPLIGKEGIALTDLKPAAFVLIENKKYNAQSSGEFINRDFKVKVIEASGSYLIVQKLEEN